MEPRAPENIRIEYPSGEIIPLEAVYTGIDPDGNHRWEVTITIGSRHARAIVCGDANLRVDMIPAQTGITVRLGNLLG